MRDLFLVLLSLCPAATHAEGQEVAAPHSLSLEAGILTGYAYDLRVGYHYFFHRYVGVGGHLGACRQWRAEHVPHGDLTEGRWTSWRLDRQDERVEKLYLAPLLCLRTPDLVRLGQWQLGLQAEPGVRMQLPLTAVGIRYSQGSQSTYKIRLSARSTWCFWDVRTLLQFRREGIALALGYGLSNLDVYSPYRPIRVEGTRMDKFYPTRRLSHTLFVSAGVPL